MALPACSGSPRPAAGEPLSVRTIAGEWTLVTIGGEEVAALLSADDRSPTVRIGGDGGLSGFAGVNRINGSLDAEKLLSGRWEIGPMLSTKMAGPEPMMALEGRFLEALQSATAVTLDGGRLTLSGKKAESLVFASGQGQ